MRRRSWILIAGLTWLLGASPAGAAVGEPGDVLVSFVTEVVRIDPTTNERFSLAQGFYAALVLAPDGDLFLIGNDRIDRLDADTGEVHAVRTGFLPSGPNVQGAVWLPDGRLLVAGMGGSFSEVDPVSGDATLVLSSLHCQVSCSAVRMGSIVRTSSGRLIAALPAVYADDPGYLVEVDLASGTSQVLSSGGHLDNRSWGIAEASDGSLLLTAEAAIVRVEPATGAQSVVAEGGKLLVPWRLAVSGNGRIYATELESTAPLVGGSQVIEIDPQTGVQRILARPVSARAIAVVPGTPAPPDCSDGVDNDGDGRRDFPFDHGCSSASDGTETPPCADGIDNDLDGLIDHPDDPGCESPFAVSQESPQCSDSQDNDGDGLYDHPEDPGCLSPSDNTEHWIPPHARYLGGPDEEPGPRCGLLGAELLVPAVVLAAIRRRRARRV